MTINYKKLDVNGEDFELLCRDVLESYDALIVSEPTRGPDQKKDLVIEITSRDLLGNSEKIKYLVQCKHKAHSGRSVLEAEIGDFRSACLLHKTDGYFLITSTIASVTVANNLNAEKESGPLKVIIWDGKKLEGKIESSPNSSQIIEKYNLKENLELQFSEMRNILMGEYHLPFDLYKEVSEECFKALIFEKISYDSELKQKKEYIGFCCSQDGLTDHYTQSIKKKYKLNDIRFIVKNKPKPPNVTLPELYRELQNYRDSTYQEALWKILQFSPINPTLIRLIETSIKNIPYEPQKITIDSLNMLIGQNPSDAGIFIIKEAASASAQLNIKEAKEYIYSQLEKSDAWELNKEETPALAQTLVSALVKLDREPIEFKNNMINLLKTLSNIQVKAEIIDYFIKNKIKDDQGVLGIFFDKNAGLELPPTHHGTFFNNKRITLVKQSVPLKIDLLKTAYLHAIE